MYYKHKKGQTTLFVILGIVLVAAVLIFVVARPYISKLTMSEEDAKKLIAAESGEVREYAKACVKASVRKNINTLGRQGGVIMQTATHYSMPVGLMEDPTVLNYALYYNKALGQNVNDLPTIAEMKEELEEYTINDPALGECLRLAPFEAKFFIRTGDLEIDMENLALGETNGKIIIPFKYPIFLSVGGVSTIIDGYSATIPLNMFKVRDAAARIINSIAEEKSLSEVQIEYAQAQALELRMNPTTAVMAMDAISYDWIPSESETYNSKNILYTITYESAGLEKPFIFNFLTGQE